MEWFLFVLLFFSFALFTVGLTAPLNSRYRAEIRRLEQRVEFLYKKLEINYDKEQSALLSEKMWGLTTNGSKIEAIKAYREATGADLLTSRRAVEAMAANPGSQPALPPDATSLNHPTSPVPLSPGVMRLVEDRQKIQAIKLLREQTGLGLKEAKDLVDAYEREILLK